MKSVLRSLSIAAAAAVTMAAISPAVQAADCKSVKFNFLNNMSTKIKVRSVEIAGNDGTWTEDMANKEILTNGKYTTNGRRMNKLDSGAKPAWMKVKYDKFDAANGRWQNSLVKTFSDRQTCADGHTYVFNMQ